MRLRTESWNERARGGNNAGGHRASGPPALSGASNAATRSRQCIVMIALAPHERRLPLFEHLHRFNPLQRKLPVVRSSKVLAVHPNPIELRLARGMTFNPAIRSPGLLEDMLLQVSQPLLAQEILDPAFLFR